MSDIHIKPPSGSRKNKRIVGRGGAGRRGATAGKGTKGQNARSGGGVRPGFEGGQMPLYRRVAIRGFSNAAFKKRYEIVNVGSIGRKFEDGADVDVVSLREMGLIKGTEKFVKVLGDGSIDVKINLKVDSVSSAAKEKIEKAGGTVEIFRAEETVNGE